MLEIDKKYGDYMFKNFDFKEGLVVSIPSIVFAIEFNSADSEYKYYASYTVFSIYLLWVLYQYFHKAKKGSEKEMAKNKYIIYTSFKQSVFVLLISIVLFYTGYVESDRGWDDFTFFQESQLYMYSILFLPVGLINFIVGIYYRFINVRYVCIDDEFIVDNASPFKLGKIKKEDVIRMQVNNNFISKYLMGGEITVELNQNKYPQLRKDNYTLLLAHLNIEDGMVLAVNNF